MNAGEERQGREFVRFVVADLDGHACDIDPDHPEKCAMLGREGEPYHRLSQFVSNELGAASVCDHEPKHIEYMRRHELVDYCEVSEKGHFKWFPKGLLMQKLLLEYARRLSLDWGAFEVANPIVIRGDHNVVGQLMGEFHERDYRVDGGRGVCYLRYASDPLAFPFMQKIRFSHRQAPLRIYEEASCFRNEQQGAVSGLKRVRNFLMTDMHAACSSVEQAKAEFERLCLRFAGLMNDIIAQGRWVLGWAGTVEFFEQNRDWLTGIGKAVGVPAFFKLMPQMSHYYAMKNEFQAITEDKSNIQVSTVQWDVKDGERFDIGYTDEAGVKQPCPVIIHASSFGSIERTLCAILENIAIDEAEGRVPLFPLWLAPTQVRLMPVARDHVSAVLGFCDRLVGQDIRADVDDRDDTLGKKIRNAETEWIPYIGVVGKREIESGMIAVRVRESGEQKAMPLDDLVNRIRQRVDGMPFRTLSLPREISRRPVFFG